jgi:beta-glucanase (GH16 family)
VVIRPTVVAALAVLLLAMAPAARAPAVAPAAQAPRQLDPPTWSDEFDGTSLDLTRWSHRATGPRHDGILTPDAVSVGDGALTITTYTEAGRHYSGMISSHEHGTAGFQQAYGYFEARVRFDSSPGQWSAFWLQSPTIGSPVGDPATAGVEMDIAEHRARCTAAPWPAPPSTCALDNDISDRIQQALIWDGYGTDTKAAVTLSDPLGTSGDGGWHTWALRWTPTDLTFYRDGAAISSMSGPISRRSQYIILSSEVGEFFAGAIPPGGYGSRATSTTRMQVDYVRVWSLGTAPRSTAPPATSGTPEAGETLTCSPGAWTGDPAPELGYEWLSDGSPLQGATGPAYTVRSTDAGHALSCRVTATNSAGSAAAISEARAIPVAPLPPRRTAAPPAPPRAVDTAAPSARLLGSASQRVGPSVGVTISCPDESCRATAGGTVRVPQRGGRSATSYAPRAVTTAIAGGARATVRLRLHTRARAAIRRALRAGRRVALRVRVDVADGAGNSRPLTRRVALRL